MNYRRAVGHHDGPRQRILLQVTLDDAAQADEMFSRADGRGRRVAPQLHPAQRQRRPLPRHLRTRRAPGAVTRGDTDGELPTTRPRDRPGRARRPDRAGRPAAEMQRSYLDYAMSVIVGGRCPTCATASSRCTAACSTRCTTAATAPTAATPSAPASSATSWAVPPARRQRRSTTPWCAWPAVVDALPAGRRPGQLRLARQRPGGRPCATPSAAWRRWPWRWSATSTRRPSTSAPTTTAARRSRSSCRPVPEPAGQRLGRHRGRHGHEHPAAQPARGRRGRAVGAGQPEATREELLEALMERVKGPTSPPAR
jgi:hypothetical protein